MLGRRAGSTASAGVGAGVGVGVGVGVGACGSSNTDGGGFNSRKNVDAGRANALVWCTVDSDGTRAWSSFLSTSSNIDDGCSIK